MDPRDFRILAAKLAETTTAAELRTAVSRAYYAVFLVSLDILNEMGFTIPRNHTGHAEVQRYFSNSDNTDIQGIGQKLNDLRGKRIHADYDLTRSDVENPNTVRLLMFQAKQMIEMLESHSSGSRRAELRRAIQHGNGRRSI